MAALIIASLSRILKLSDSTLSNVVGHHKRGGHDTTNTDSHGNNNVKTNNDKIRSKIEIQRTSETKLITSKKSPSSLSLFNQDNNSHSYCHNWTENLLTYGKSYPLSSKSSTHFYGFKNKRILTRMAHLNIENNNKAEHDRKCKSTSDIVHSFSIENSKPEKYYPNIEKIQQGKYTLGHDDHGYENSKLLDSFNGKEEPLCTEEKMKNNETLGFEVTTNTFFDEYASEPSMSWDHHDHHLMKRALSSSMTNLSVDQSFSKTSLCSDSGLSAMYTSTPIKNKAEVENDIFNNPTISSRSFPGTPTTSTTTKTNYSSPNHIVPISSIHLNPSKMYDENLSHILEEGNEEFRTKYSTWITQLFHLQLTKTHRRLTHQYNRKIDQIVKEQQNIIWDIEHKNRKKILEQQATIDKYQSSLSSLNEENKRIKKAKQVIIDEFQKAAIQTKQNFEAELEQHISIKQAEYEREKLELNKKHAEQLKVFFDKSCTQIEKVEHDYKEQIEILSKLVNELEMRNEQLDEQVKMYKRLAESTGPNSLRIPISSGSYCFQREKEHLLAVIQDVKNKLYDAEKDKTMVIAEYEEKLIQLNQEFDKHDRDLVKQLENSQRNFEILHQAYENEIKKYQAKLEEQNANSQNIIENLRGKYGEKIKTLTEMVEKLQSEVIGRAINSKNSKLT